MKKLFRIDQHGKTSGWVVPALFCAVFGLVGCGEKNESSRTAKKEVRAVREQAKDVAEEVTEGAKAVGEKVKEKTEEGVDKVKEGTEGLIEKGQDALEEVKEGAALDASSHDIASIESFYPVRLSRLWLDVFDEVAGKREPSELGGAVAAVSAEMLVDPRWRAQKIAYSEEFAGSLRDNGSLTREQVQEAFFLVNQVMMQMMMQNSPVDRRNGGRVVAF